MKFSCSPIIVWYNFETSQMVSTRRTILVWIEDGKRRNFFNEMKILIEVISQIRIKMENIDKKILDQKWMTQLTDCIGWSKKKHRVASNVTWWKQKIQFVVKFSSWEFPFLFQKWRGRMDVSEPKTIVSKIERASVRSSDWFSCSEENNRNELFYCKIVTLPDDFRWLLIRWFRTLDATSGQFHWEKTSKNRNRNWNLDNIQNYLLPSFHLSVFLSDSNSKCMPQVNCKL